MLGHVKAISSAYAKAHMVVNVTSIHKRFSEINKPPIHTMSRIGEISAPCFAPLYAYKYIPIYKYPRQL